MSTLSAAPPSPRKPATADDGLSVYMTIVLVFVTVGFVNTLLISPVNPFRCFNWNVKTCSTEEVWMLNWLALGHLHFYTLLACLFSGILGKQLVQQEDRLAYLCATLVTCSLSTGVFSLDVVNRPIAVLMAVVYIGLLAALMLQTTISTAPNLLAEFKFISGSKLLRSSSFDRRQKLPMSTLALAVVAVLAAVRCVECTFGQGLDLYQDGDTDGTGSPIYQLLSNATACQSILVTLILIWSTCQATVEQQKAVLTGQFIVSFIGVLMLAGSQGEQMPTAQTKAVGVSNFLGMCIALLGVS
jgi:alkylhydroperoxidase/carboxymuconolactone decarboxylase family protein YurZ